jgi:hypothetical protein
MVRRLMLVAAGIGLGLLPSGLTAAATGDGLAARYPGDADIAKDPAVIFADDFESWGDNGTRPPAGTWTVQKHPATKVQVVPGKVTKPGLSGPGGHVLQLAYWKREKGGTAGGLELLLGNYNTPNDGRGDGYDEVYIRYYIKFDERYTNVGNHGSNLGGRDPSRESWWVGQAGMPDVGLMHYFYSGLQPYPHGKTDDPGVREWEFGFYSYHLDKPDAWGERFPARRQVFVRAGRWYCLERHLKLNSVDPGATTDPPVAKPPAAKPKTPAERAAAAARARAVRQKLNEKARLDGIEELWVDGLLTVRRPVRYRRDPNLRITCLTLENWYPKMPAEYTPERPLKVDYDNVVIAREYIGPIRAPAPKPGENRRGGPRRDGRPAPPGRS